MAEGVFPTSVIIPELGIQFPMSGNSSELLSDIGKRFLMSGNGFRCWETFLISENGFRCRETVSDVGKHFRYRKAASDVGEQFRAILRYRETVSETVIRYRKQFSELRKYFSNAEFIIHTVEE